MPLLLDFSPFLYPLMKNAKQKIPLRVGKVKLSRYLSLNSKRF